MKQASLIGLLMAVSLAAGCAHQRQQRPIPPDYGPLATEEELQLMLGGVIGCYRANESRLDDGISQATIIATALRRDCQGDIDAYSRSQAKGYPPGQLRYIEDLQPEAQQQLALRIVLEERAKRRPAGH